MGRKFTRRNAMSKTQKQQVSRIAKNIISRSSETKHYDAQDEGRTVSSTMYIGSITNIAQGDSDTNRDGDQLLLKNIRVKYLLRGADTTNAVRVMFVQYYCADVPVVSDILQDNNPGDRELTSMYHSDARPSFKVLYDRTHVLNTTGSNATVYKQINLHNFGRKKIQYQGGTTTGRGEVYVFLLSDSVATAHPTFSAQYRVAFKDF